MTTTVRFQNQDIPLLGTPPNVGEQIPALRLSINPGEILELSFPREKPLILTTAPSVDTPVCANQLRLFDEKLQAAGGDIEIFFVTRDLPFALNRFVEEQGLQQVVTLSDFKERELGAHLGLEIPSMGLLARTVFVIDTDGTVIYREIVPEISALPDLDAAWNAATSRATVAS